VGAFARYRFALPARRAGRDRARRIRGTAVVFAPEVVATIGGWGAGPGRAPAHLAITERFTATEYVFAGLALVDGLLRRVARAGRRIARTRDTGRWGRIADLLDPGADTLSTGTGVEAAQVTVDVTRRAVGLRQAVRVARDGRRSGCGGGGRGRRGGCRR